MCTCLTIDNVGSSDIDVSDIINDIYSDRPLIIQLTQITASSFDDCKDKRYLLPLKIALQEKYISSKLIDINVKVNENSGDSMAGMDGLITCLNILNIDAFKLLIEHGCDVNKIYTILDDNGNDYRCTLLHIIINRLCFDNYNEWQMDILSLILPMNGIKNDVDDEKSNSKINNSPKEKEKEKEKISRKMVHFDWNKLINFNQTRNVFHECCYSSNLNGLKYLLKYEKDKDIKMNYYEKTNDNNDEMQSDTTGLLLAMHARYHSTQYVKFLLKNFEFNINDCDANGSTPLILATKKRFEDEVKMFLDYKTKDNKDKYKCNVYIKDKYNKMTALMYGIQNYSNNYNGLYKCSIESISNENKILYYLFNQILMTPNTTDTKEDDININESESKKNDDIGIGVSVSNIRMESLFDLAYFGDIGTFRKQMYLLLNDKHGIETWDDLENTNLFKNGTIIQQCIDYAKLNGSLTIIGFLHNVITKITHFLFFFLCVVFLDLIHFFVFCLVLFVVLLFCCLWQVERASV